MTQEKEIEARLLNPNFSCSSEIGFIRTGLHYAIGFRRYYKDHYIRFVFRFPFPLEIVKTTEFMDKCAESMDEMIKQDLRNYNFLYDSFSFDIQRYRMIDTNNWYATIIYAPRDKACEVLKSKGLFTKENLGRIEKDYQLSAEEEAAEYEAFKKMEEENDAKT